MPTAIYWTWQICDAHRHCLQVLWRWGNNCLRVEKASLPFWKLKGQNSIVTYAIGLVIKLGRDSMPKHINFPLRSVPNCLIKLMNVRERISLSGSSASVFPLYDKSLTGVYKRNKYVFTKVCDNTTKDGVLNTLEIKYIVLIKVEPGNRINASQLEWSRCWLCLSQCSLRKSNTSFFYKKFSCL